MDEGKDILDSLYIHRVGLLLHYFRFFLALLIIEKLYVFVDGFGSLDFACLLELFERFIFQFKQKLFVYGLQLEHQMLEVLLSHFHFVPQFVQYVCHFTEQRQFLVKFVCFIL